MRRLSLVIGILIVVLVLCRGSVQLAHAADYSLSGDSDCAAIGIWNATTKTCTLSGNVHGSIEIRGSDITLDGAGYAIVGPGVGYGIEVAFPSGAAILNFRMTNVTVSGWSTGIWMYRSYYTIIANTTIADNGIGVYLIESPFVTLSSNTIRGNAAGIFTANWFDGLTMHGNTLENNGLQIQLNFINSYAPNLSIDTSNTMNGKPIYYFENENGTIHENLGAIGALYCFLCTNVTFGGFSIDGSGGPNGTGLQFWNSDDNIVNHGVFSNLKVGASLSNSKRNFFHDNTFRIVNHTPDQGPAIGVVVAVDPFQNIENWFLDNNFIEPEPLSSATRPVLTRNQNFGSNSHFYSPLLERGNYWSRFDTPAEGCIDADSNRKCDGFFYLDDGGPYATEIYYAWTMQNGWVVPPSVPSIVSISPMSGPAGTLVTITGANFGSTQGSSTVTFDSTVATVSLWSDIQIQATVPSLSVGTYDVVVTTSAGSSNLVSFQITPHVPVILVHGWCSDPAEAFGPFDTGNSLPQLLEQKGFPVALANYSEAPCLEKWCIEENPCVGCDRKTIEALAVRLALQIGKVRRKYNAPQVDIVAHSMGGLVTRAYIAGLAQDRLVHAPYSGQIRRLVMAGTPNYGAAVADLSLLSFGCSQTHAKQLEMGSLFIWKLHRAWEIVIESPDILVIAGTMGDLTPLGDSVDDNDDGLVNIYSTALTTSPSSIVRYVPYKHAPEIPFPRNTPSLVKVDNQDHATFQLSLPFLLSKVVLPQCCGMGTVDYQPSVAALNRGMLVLQLINERDKLHKDIEFVDVEFSPPADWDNRDENNQGGSLTLIGINPPGMYDITVRDPIRQGTLNDVLVPAAGAALYVVRTSQSR